MGLQGLSELRSPGNKKGKQEKKRATKVPEEIDPFQAGSDKTPPKFNSL